MNESAATRIFLSVFTLCVIWILFINDYSNVELQSPVKFGNLDLSTASAAVVKPVESPKAKKPAKSDPLPVTENDAAPMVDLPPADIKGYIKTYAALAVEEMRRTGIPASVSMAQGIVESRAGRSGLATTANNHFGMKCHVKGKCVAGHCINFTDDVDVDYFLVFQNAYKSWKAHSELLQKPRYSKCFTQTSYQGWAKQLKACGYATDPTYSQKLISIIEKYKLYMLDEKS